MKVKNKNGMALFIMPRNCGAWRGSEALWITVGGWAAAAKEKFGRAYVMTTDRIATPEEALTFPLQAENSIKRTRKFGFKFIPRIFITFIKDILLWRSSRRNENYDYDIPDEKDGILLIWEQHDFFSGPGYRLSKKYNVPFIIYVHAPQVWESQKWGVKRPLWGKYLEKQEIKSLMRADLIACVSDQVAVQLKKIGIPGNKIMISPMSVDLNLFNSRYSNEIPDVYDIKGNFVIGWTGSFRSFHGLEILLQVFKKVYEKLPNTRLMLVGDGFEKSKIERLSEILDISHAVIFPGRKSFREIPAYVAAFDLAIVSAKTDKDFHYSPLKLREYLGAGKPTLAPDAGEIRERFRDNIHLQLYKVGDIEDTSDKIINLYHDEIKRNRLAKEGMEFIAKNGTWAVELNKALEKLEMI